MGEEFVFRKSISEMEEEFQRIRRATNDEYEQELQQQQAEWEIQQKNRGRNEREMKALLSECGMDMSKIDKMEKQEEALLDEFIKRNRPPLVERDPQRQARLRDQLLRSSYYTRFGWSQAHLIGADMLSPDSESLKGVEGEHGNPGVWLYNAQKVEDKSIATGGGWGCIAGGHTPYAHTSQWYYDWVPPENGKYWIYGGINYHGFYMLYANDQWYNCKKAKVHIFTDIELHQYFPRGKHQQRVFDREDDNISESGLVEGARTWSFYETLGGGDVVYIQVRFAIDAFARGGGSYAEANFMDGNANYIDAPVVFITRE